MDSRMEKKHVNSYLNIQISFPGDFSWKISEICIGQPLDFFCCGWRGQGPPYHRGVGGSFEKKILMFFKNKKVRIFFNFTKSFRIVSENDCQWIRLSADIRAFKTRVEGKRRIDLGNPPEVSKYPPKFFACGADFRSVEFHDFSTCLQMVAKQI